MPDINPAFQSESASEITFSYSTTEFRNAAPVNFQTLFSVNGIVVTGYNPVGEIRYVIPSVYFEPSETIIKFNAKCIGDALNLVTGAYQFLPYRLKNWGVIDSASPVFRINGVQKPYNMQAEGSLIQTTGRVTDIVLNNLQMQIADYLYYNTLFFQYTGGAVHYARLLLQVSVMLKKPWRKSE